MAKTKAKKGRVEKAQEALIRARMKLRIAKLIEKELELARKNG